MSMLQHWSDVSVFWLEASDPDEVGGLEEGWYWSGPSSGYDPDPAGPHDSFADASADARYWVDDDFYDDVEPLQGSDMVEAAV